MVSKCFQHIGISLKDTLVSSPFATAVLGPGSVLRVLCPKLAQIVWTQLFETQCHVVVSACFQEATMAFTSKVPCSHKFQLMSQNLEWLSNREEGNSRALAGGVIPALRTGLAERWHRFAREMTQSDWTTAPPETSEWMHCSCWPIGNKVGQCRTPRQTPPKLVERSWMTDGPSPAQMMPWHWRWMCPSTGKELISAGSLNNLVWAVEVPESSGTCIFRERFWLGLEFVWIGSHCALHVHQYPLPQAPIPWPALFGQLANTTWLKDAESKSSPSSLAVACVVELSFGCNGIWRD